MAGRLVMMFSVAFLLAGCLSPASEVPASAGATPTPEHRGPPSITATTTAPTPTDGPADAKAGAGPNVTVTVVDRLWHNETVSEGLADCEILSDLTNAGVPEENLPPHLRVPLAPAIANGSYGVALRAYDDAWPEPELADELCIGFTRDDVHVLFHHNTTGAIPAGADTLLIAGDLRQWVHASIVVAAPELDLPDPRPAPWQSGPWIPAPEEAGPSVFD